MDQAESSASSCSASTSTSVSTTKSSTFMKLAASTSCDSGAVSDQDSKACADVIERQSVFHYHPPLSNAPPKRVDWVYNPTDGSVLLDHKGRPISVDRLLATKPLRGELSTRPGPGNKKLTYISGEGVSRTLNDIFGFDGWNLDISRVQREECLKDPTTGKYTVVYTAMVRLTHKASGAYKEDCGAGDATDRQFGTAISHALKASITDALKRAARHFGDKLGNSLYQGSFSVSKAPVTLKDALDRYDIERANTKFGFPKDQAQPVAQDPSNLSATFVSKAQHASPAPPPHVDASHGFPTSLSSPNNFNGRVLPIAPPKNVQCIISESSKEQCSKSSSLTVAQAVSGSCALRPSGTQYLVHTSTPSQQTTIPQPQQVSWQRQQTSQTVQSAPAPPPTPTDSLRNSALFTSDFFHENSPSVPTNGIKQDSVPPPRPVSSYGHNRPVGFQSATDSDAINGCKNDPRRVSIEDGLRIQPPSIVTPTNHHLPGARNKRPPLNSILHIDHSQTKKVSTNPYSAGNVISRPSA